VFIKAVTSKKRSFFVNLPSAPEQFIVSPWLDNAHEAVDGDGDQEYHRCVPTREVGKRLHSCCYGSISERPESRK